LLYSYTIHHTATDCYLELIAMASVLGRASYSGCWNFGGGKFEG